MEADKLLQMETRAIGEAEQLSGAYRARISGTMECEEINITLQIPSLTAWFNAEVIRTRSRDAESNGFRS